MAKKLISLVVSLSLVLTACAFAFAETASASAPSAEAAEYVPKIVSDNPNLYTKIELDNLDKSDNTIAKYDTNDDNLPDIDVYLFPSGGLSVKDYALEEAKHYGGTVFQLNPDSDVYFYYDIEMFDGRLFIVLNRIFPKDSENLYEICYYYKMTDVAIGDSGLVFSIPNGYKKGAVSDDMTKQGFTDYFDYTNVVKDGTAVSSTLKAVLVGSADLAEGESFEDYIAVQQACGAQTVFTTYARHPFYKVISSDESIFKNAKLITLCTEIDGTVYKICMVFDSDTFGIDTMIGSTIGAVTADAK